MFIYSANFMSITLTTKRRVDVYPSYFSYEKLHVIVALCKRVNLFKTKLHQNRLIQKQFHKNSEFRIEGTEQITMDVLKAEIERKRKLLEEKKLVVCTSKYIQFNVHFK